MSGQDGVVGFNNSRGHFRSGIDGELQLGFLAVFHGETFHEQGGESGSCAPTKAVEDEEPLESGALVRQFTDSVQDPVHNPLPYGVVSTGIVVSSIFFSSDKLIWVEESTVGTCTYFI